MRKGKNHVFGTDFEHRESLSGPAADSLFDEVWREHIEPAIQTGKIIESEDVRRRIPEQSRRFIRSDAQHHEFRLSGSLWIAQISGGRNDQLWIVSNKAYDTRSVIATFHTQEERDFFDELARKFKLKPQDYARKILEAHLSIYRSED